MSKEEKFYDGYQPTNNKNGYQPIQEVPTTNEPNPQSGYQPEVDKIDTPKPPSKR